MGLEKQGEYLKRGEFLTVSGKKNKLNNKPVCSRIRNC